MLAAGCLTPRSSTVRCCRGEAWWPAATGPMPTHLGPHKQKVESGARVGLHARSKVEMENRGPPTVFWVLCIASCTVC